MTDINDLVDQWVKNGLPNTLRGLAADVWDQCSEQWISDLSYDVSAPANPYRKTEPKPEPTYDHPLPTGPRVHAGEHAGEHAGRGRVERTDLSSL